MRFLSVCSGIEAASQAWRPLGWEAVAFSEIEPFPCAVLKELYPNVPNWGDMTRFKEWLDASFDVLCGGTPCQSFSVAGLRKGLDDPRGDLMLTFGAIAGRYRPRWLVWENVPGVLSSNGGRDFGSFLGLLGLLGYGFAYRVLDAQYFGVAQRRRRVFVVGYLGNWRYPAAVLFERHSLSGHPAPSREKGEGIAPILEAGARTGKSTTDPRAGSGIGEDGDPMFSLQAGKQHAVTLAVAPEGRAQPNASHRLDSEAYVAHSLTGNGFDASEDGTGRGTPLVAIRTNQTGANGRNFSEGIALSIGANESQQAVSTPDTQVRRLMPIECERLQGFPDGYTAITYRGKPAADGPRYKALGNSWAVPCARWIGERIERLELVLNGRSPTNPTPLSPHRKDG